MYYNINEVFVSIQGEGVQCGEQAAFIRAQGCPVGCPWCDSGPFYHPDVPQDPLVAAAVRVKEGSMVEVPTHIPSKGNTWPGGLGKRLDQYGILAQIPEDIPRIVITGGEPTLQDWDDVINTWQSLVGHARTQFALETSGQYPWLGSRFPHWVTVSPKWAHAANKTAWYIDTCWWAWVDELKYVVDDQFSEEVVYEHLRLVHEYVPDRYMPHVVLMPEGSPPSKESIALTLGFLQRHHDWRMGPRLQYYLGVK